MAEIKALIFDLGKVVFDLSFDRVFHSWAKDSGLAFDVIKSRFMFDEAFSQFERNELTPSQYRSYVMNKLGIKLSDEDFDRGWCDLYLDTYPELESLLIKLKQNYRLVALTNTNKIHEKVWKTKYQSTLLHFEKVFSSSDINTRKPESESYKIVLDYLQGSPEEALFLDDNADNTNGAEILGIKSILVTSPSQLINDLGEIMKW